LHGLAFDSFFPVAEWQRFDEEILPVLEREGQWRGEMTGKRPDNRTFPLEMSLGRIEGGGIFCIVHDISDRRKAEQALQRVNRKLNLLSTFTRRDISSQLFTLLGYVHIAKQLAKESEVKPYLDKMESSMRVIHERITFTGNYQDMGMTAPTWQVLNRVFLYAISHLDLGGISRKTNLDGISIYADPMLEKALFNLVKNTLLHAKTATEIRFSFQECPGGLLLVYEDNGVGIRQEEKELIFSPDARPAGGFGLFLVREILTITEISIRETGNFGSGARFEILVPPGVYRIDELTPSSTLSLSKPENTRTDADMLLDNGGGP
jgi:signal transduction histidine kinase